MTTSLLTTPAWPDNQSAPLPKELAAPTIDIVIPVHNEERDLEPAVRRLHGYLTATFPYTFRITIADNASTDATNQVSRRLQEEFAEVAGIRLAAKGRGRALREAWTASRSPVLGYMDVDLSTDLGALLPLVAPLLTGHSEVSIGSRLTRAARVQRGAKRELISRGYNVLLRTVLGARFSDAQCGFKAIRKDVADQLLPLVEDNAWFFDTELLVLAQRAGMRIHEVPVDWVDDPDSTVEIVPTAVADLKGMWRVGSGLLTGRLAVGELRRRWGRPDHGSFARLLRFAAIGIASTAAYLLLYALLRTTMVAQLANVTALLVTAIANTAANRRITFGVRGPQRAWRHQLQGLVVFALALTLTSSCLAFLYAATAQPPRLLELTVLVIANLAGTVLRYLLLRRWVFRPA